MFFAFFQETPILMSNYLVSRCSCLYLTRPPSIVHKQRHFYLMLKNPNFIVSSQLIEKKTPLRSYYLHFTEAATRSCSLNKNVHLLRSGLKRLFFTWQLFTEHRFLKNHSAWLLLRSKLYFESYSVLCLRKVRMLQKGFSQLSVKWSVK